MSLDETGGGKELVSETRVTAFIKKETTYKRAAAGPESTATATQETPATTVGSDSDKKNGEAEDTGSLADQGMPMLTMQIDEYLELCGSWARTWMILFVAFLLVELLLALTLALTFFIAYDKEILTSGRPLDTIVTWWNLRVVIVAILIANLLVILASSFNKRWRLNHGTLRKLVSLKIDATNPQQSVDGIRKELKAILDDHHRGVQQQKTFQGPKL